MQGEQNAIDFLKDNLQAVNKRKYLQTVRQQFAIKQKQQQKQQNKMPSQEQLASVIEQYEDYYLKFMYKDTLMTNSKSNGLIDECLNNVHQGLKTKKDCKYILSIMTKIFVQQLIEQSLQVVQEYKRADKQQKSLSNNSLTKQKMPQQIDIDVIEEAIRRRTLKKQPL